MTQTTSFSHEPSHWHLLSEGDTHAYRELRASFQEDAGKSRKGERLDSFTSRLDKVRLFIDHEPFDSWKRSLVCGIFFVGEGLALNIHQLGMLIGKCKSSINGSLQRLGYNAPFPGHPLEQQLPSNFRASGALKKWTFRVKNCEVKSAPPTPFLVPLPVRHTPEVEVEPEAIQAQFARKIPCPIKWRYKFWKIIECVGANQTGP